VKRIKCELPTEVKFSGRRLSFLVFDIPVSG
jgi:hypothetical protein